MEFEVSAFEIESKAKQLENVWNGEEIRRSISLFIKAGNIWEKESNFQKTSECFRNAANLSIQINKYDNAQQYLQKVLTIDRKYQLINSEVKTLSLFTILEKLRGNLTKSQSYADEALNKSKLADDDAKAFANYVAGQYAFHYGSLDDAIEYTEKAHKFVKNSNDKNLEASVLSSLGISSAIKGNKKLGIEQMQSAFDIWKSIENKRGIAHANNGFGFIYTITDEKQKALKYYLAAKELFPEGVDQIQKAKANTGIGAIYFEFGQTEFAKTNIEIALDIFKQTKYDFGKLASLPILAEINYLNGDTETSTKLFDEAFRLAVEQGTDFFKAEVIEQLGNIDFDVGNFNEALRKFKESLLTKNRLGVPFPRLKNKIGKTYEKIGDFENAYKNYQLALNESRQIQEAIQIGESLHNLANLNYLENKFDLALNNSTESLEITESLYKDVSNHNMRQSFFSNSFDRYELNINILMKMHELFPSEGYELKALQTSEKSRSRLMRENLKFSTVDQMLDADPQLVEKEKEFSYLLGVKKADLSILLGQKKPDEEVEKLTDEIAQIDDQLQTIKSALRETSPIYSLIKHSNEFDYSEFQNKILDDKTVLLEFFFGKEKSFVWLIENDNVSILELPKCETINEQIESLLNLMKSIEDAERDNIARYQKRFIQIEKQYWKDASSLSNLLLGSFANKIKNKRIIIVPDGKLRYFPISALPVPDDSENTPLLLTNEIVYEPSASMLYLLKTVDRKNSIPQKDFLVYSDPIFTTDDVRLTTPIKLFKEDTLTDGNSPGWNDEESISELARLTRLNASEEEASNIFQFFDLSNSNVVKGFEANRQNFLAENLLDYKVLHFATHGILNEENSKLSGIVLSQFDEKGTKQNGLIWLQDIYGLKLSTDLVVLSACHTGVGEDIKGEGLMSLTNGFLQVGAKSVISSHWKVNDEATVALMNDFYEILANEDISTSEALHKAKIKMYKNPNYKFPYYWASFTFHGDFQNKPNLNTNPKYSKFIFLAVFSLAFLSLFLMIKNYLTAKE